MKPKPYDKEHLKQVLHQNELTDELGVIRDWAKAHIEIVLIGALVLAAAAFGTYTFIKGRNQKALDAAMLLNQAQSAFEQAGSQAPAQAAAGYAQARAKYEALADSYEGSVQGKAARLGVANADLALGKGADAEREYAALDGHEAADGIAALAGLGRARALELEGKSADALGAYADVLRNYPGSVVENDAKAAQARLGGAAPKP